MLGMFVPGGAPRSPAHAVDRAALAPLPPETALTIRMHLIHGTLVVRPQGDMTTVAARELQEEIEKELAPGSHDVVLNLSGVERIDAGALPHVFLIQKRARDGEARFCIAQPSAAALRLFECTNVARHLEMVASEDEVLRTTVA